MREHPKNIPRIIKLPIDSYLQYDYVMILLFTQSDCMDMKTVLQLMCTMFFGILNHLKIIE